MTEAMVDDALVEALLTQESEGIVRDMAAHVGDEIHAVLKRHGMMMATTGGTVAVGVLAAVQVLAETIAFARRSMDGDADDEKAIALATMTLFATQAAGAIPEFAAIAYPAGVAAGREEACQAIEQRITEGYDVPARKVDQCAHGKFGWEDCIACYDDALEGTIAAIRQRGE